MPIIIIVDSGNVGVISAATHYYFHRIQLGDLTVDNNHNY